ncbi:hypothetical protein GT347_14885 [Xylophilus rhododendri]|uniref:Uncharacterized protein n=1 Tax=Xylophilus rhododendri TaxID=2697032 RepID=A0A857J605_9BURK|nr:hypothetical protein [Xylophilus rhododendri]QHI99147.1 hypothetical protein GT347_14885 [Xylophilus rhododendri]
MIKKEMLIKCICWAWRLIVVMPVLLVVMAFVWYLLAAYDRQGLNRKVAHARATNLMINLCKDNCEKLGIQPVDLKERASPSGMLTDYELALKAEDLQKKYMFSWLSKNGVELNIMVWDNGLYVDSQYSWDVSAQH